MERPDSNWIQSKHSSISIHDTYKNALDFANPPQIVSIQVPFDATRPENEPKGLNCISDENVIKKIIEICAIFMAQKSISGLSYNASQIYRE